jgi:D-serine deaminase-like pyridoxal phosphate-dependent protein
VAFNKVADLAALRNELEKHGGTVRLLIDHPDQVKFLEEYESLQEVHKRWSAFIKINGGQK